MLNWTNIGLARAYFLFVFLAQLGTLQLVAIIQGWQGLSMVGRPSRPKWGYAVGGALLVLSYGWFFGFRHDIYAPGPAGIEVTLLFCGAGMLAVGLTLGLAELCHHIHCIRDLDRSFTERHGGCIELELLRLEVEEVAEWGAMGRVPVGAFSGVLFLPAPRKETFPAVCLIPGPFTDKELVHWLITELVGTGFIVLLVEMGPDMVTYPEVLALVPSALSYLCHLPQIDVQRFGVIGIDIGADTVIRAASTDERIKAVVAIAPLLTERPAGLSLLREMTFRQAWRWSSLGKRAKVVADLGALAALVKMATTQVLLVMGGKDPVNKQVRATLDQHALAGLQLRLISGETRATLYRNRAAAWAAVSWIREGLQNGS